MGDLVGDSVSNSVGGYLVSDLEGDLVSDSVSGALGDLVDALVGDSWWAVSGGRILVGDSMWASVLGVRLGGEFGVELGVAQGKKTKQHSILKFVLSGEI